MAAGYRIWGVKVKTLSIVTGIAIVTGIVSGLALFGVNRTNAATCTGNDIIKCGFSTPSDFIAKVRANNNGVNNIPDLQSIYAHYGLSVSEYDDFAAHAVSGEAMRDGRVIVNGKVVLTGGMSIGRFKSFQGSNPFTVSISGHDYFGNVDNQVFAAGVNQIPVFVLLNSDGTFKFAVMPSCGNPEFGTPTAPAPKPKPTPTPPPTPPPVISQVSAPTCQSLIATPSVDDKATFSFVATAVPNGNRFLSGDIFFGDGNVQNSISPNSDGMTISATHTYTISGAFTAFAILHFIAPDQEAIGAEACVAVVSPVIPTAPTTPATPPPVVTQAASVPQPLPNTGAGDVIGLFTIVTAAGYLSYRVFLHHKLSRD